MNKLKSSRIHFEYTHNIWITSGYHYVPNLNAFQPQCLNCIFIQNFLASSVAIGASAQAPNLLPMNEPLLNMKDASFI